MTHRDSRAEYEERIHRVLKYIDEHLAEPLDFTTLAGVAHFSAYHFHRLFSAWTGETVGEFVRRRRVEVAAIRMAAQPRLSITEVALSAGYGSTEAFTHALKTNFGTPPTSWRREQAARHRERRNSGQAVRKADQAPETNPGHRSLECFAQAEPPVDIRLLDRKATEVAYLRHVGPYGEPVSLFWQRSVYPWLAQDGLLSRPRYGISHDDPSVTDPRKCRYDACVEVPDTAILSGGAQRMTLPGGGDAVAQFRGTINVLPDAWAALLCEGLPSSGLQLDARAAFEHYPAGSSYDEATGVFDCEICVPVAPLWPRLPRRSLSG